MLWVAYKIDAFDPAYAPATGTPEVGGLSSYEGLALLRGMAGLDLVGADIVHTVAVDVSSMSIAVLGLVVLIRAFLIFSLEIEITGRLPWQRAVPGENVRPG